MPSDIPPKRPDGLGTPRRAAPSPSIVDPAMRRQWVREAEAAPVPGRRDERSQSRSFVWGGLIATIVIGVLILRREVGPPDAPPVAAVPAVSAPAAPALPVLPAPEPEVVRAYGQGAVSQAGRDGMRVGQVSAQAVSCGLQQTAWLARARDGWADQATLRYRSFDENSRAAVLLKSYLVVAFMAGQQAGERDVAARGRDGVCADLALSTDYQAAARAVSQAGKVNQ